MFCTSKKKRDRNTSDKRISYFNCEELRAKKTCSQFRPDGTFGVVPKVNDEGRVRAIDSPKRRETIHYQNKHELGLSKAIHHLMRRLKDISAPFSLVCRNLHGEEINTKLPKRQFPPAPRGARNTRHCNDRGGCRLNETFIPEDNADTVKVSRATTVII